MTELFISDVYTALLLLSSENHHISYCALQCSGWFSAILHISQYINCSWVEI